MRVGSLNVFVRFVSLNTTPFPARLDYHGVNFAQFGILGSCRLLEFCQLRSLWNQSGQFRGTSDGFCGAGPDVIGTLLRRSRHLDRQTSPNGCNIIDLSHWILCRLIYPHVAHHHWVCLQNTLIGRRSLSAYYPPANAGGCQGSPFAHSPPRMDRMKRGSPLPLPSQYSVSNHLIAG